MMVLYTTKCTTHSMLLRAWNNDHLFTLADGTVTYRTRLEKKLKPNDEVKLICQTKEKKEILSTSGRNKPRIYHDPPHDISAIVRISSPTTTTPDC